ncbi:MAG: hypothetical protein ACI837_002937 [Crocinitomicaceae bacterium]|jgi:hypothetical protein
MKIKIVLSLFVVGMFFVSCKEEDKWPESSKIEFNSGCVSSYVESFTATMGDLISEVNLEKLDKVAEQSCSCQYESMKKNYDSAEEAFKVDVDVHVANAAECEVTEAQIDDLLIK